jgi:hypothetical protein
MNRKEAVCKVFKNGLTVLMLCIAGSLLFSCSSSDDTPVPVSKVLLVYLGGDNNLSGESKDKFDAIRQGYDGRPGTKILVYIDARNEVPQLWELSGKSTAWLVRQCEEENSADAAVLRRVITEAKAIYPQAVFNLLVFSHASGWLPPNALTRPKSAAETRSVIIDGNDGMELADFAAAIPDHCFKHIVFETCFMAGVEVAYQLRDKAEYILASSAETVSPGFSDVYREHINELVHGDPQKFMQAAFDYFDSKDGYMRSATLSVIKTDALGDLAGYIRNNCDPAKETDLTEMQYFDRSSYRLFADFGDYYLRLPETKEQKETLSGLISACVPWKVATPSFMEGYNGFTIRNHSGLTAYIMQERYPELNETYKKLDWYKAITTGEE